MSQVSRSKKFYNKCGINSLIFRSYTLALLFRRRSIYMEAVNWNIHLFMQSGLTVKWRKESQNYFKIEEAFKHRRLVKSTRVKIKMNHLQVAFLSLLSGYVMSAFVFLIEKYCNAIVSNPRLTDKCDWRYDYKE